jgi:signal transduction histidine kinase
VAAGCAAGPWPALPISSLIWRLPLAAVAALLAARLWPVRRWVLIGVAAAALALDAFVPSLVPAKTWSARASLVVRSMQESLGALAATGDVRKLLTSGGGEAEPEAPFAAASQALRSLPLRVDSLVFVDERGEPVAWAGDKARLPLRMRPLGVRAIVAEPGLHHIWLWWREPLLEGGRSLGSLLAGVAIPESGGRRVLGVWAGRTAWIVPRWEGGEPVLAPNHARLLGIGVFPFRPVAWSSAGSAMVVLAIVFALAAPVALRLAMLAAAAATLVWQGWLGWDWWLVLGLTALAWSVNRLRQKWPGRRRWAWLAGVLAAGVAGCAAWLLPGLLTELDIHPVPPHLLWPGAVAWALAVALTLLLRVLRREGWRVPLLLAVVAWVPLAIGVWRAEPLVLGIGVAVLALVGSRRRATMAAALTAAAVLLGSDWSATRTHLVATTETTLAHLEKIEAPARALLASLPDPALDDLVRLSPGERLVVLGRLAGWLDLARVLPGTSLVIVDPGGSPAATWGESGAGEVSAPREVASRLLHGGWRLTILTPAEPKDVLAALHSAGVGTPVAAFDRSGAPTARGAIFRPLTPSRVGRALAEGRSWGQVGVGERVVAAYLRAHGDLVLAIPWLRAPLPEGGLILAALMLWGALPVAAWEQRRRWLEWWRQRRTFAGRVRALTAAATLVPLLLLAELLPQQWVRQQRRSRLELGRAVSQPLLAAGLEQQLPWLVRELGGAVALYRSGDLAWCSRFDLAVEGAIPWMAPREAYVRAVRGWREPLVRGDREVDVFAPVPSGEEPVVVGILRLQTAVRGGGPSPAEWFVITGVLAAGLALATAEKLGRRLAAPLRRLFRAARRIERGQRVPSLPLEGDEDVAALGRAFAAMASTVQHREEELRRERDLLERVLGTLSAGVVVVRAGGEVELANPAARELLGGEDDLGVLAGLFGPALAGMVERAAAGEGVAAPLHPPRSPDVVWQVTVLPLAGERGRLLVVMEDLSELARAERLASLAELARIVAHEVKNPLTPIRLWAEELQAALRRGPQEVVAVAEVAATQILERVEHLRDVAQGFSNLVALEHWEPRPVRLAELAREVTAEYAVLSQRGIAMQVRAEETVTVQVDPQWLRRALRHLLENSARALAGGGGEVDVEVRRAAGEAVLVVRDTGGGVPEENLGRLFEPHYSTTSHGSGLGLAVVHRVMSRAGGRVEARNVAGGLEVRLIFPGTGASTLLA